MIYFKIFIGFIISIICLYVIVRFGSHAIFQSWNEVFNKHKTSNKKKEG